MVKKTTQMEEYVCAIESVVGLPAIVAASMMYGRDVFGSRVIK